MLLEFKFSILYNYFFICDTDIFQCKTLLLYTKLLLNNCVSNFSTIKKQFNFKALQENGIDEKIIFHQMYMYYSVVFF